MSSHRVPVTKLTSRIVPLLIDDVDTDQIIPARFLKTTDRSGLADGLFADWRRDPEFVLNRPECAGARVLLAGENFGCGSSREHAAWALLAGGFNAIVALSFADIFRSNAIKNGLLPVELQPDAHGAIVSALWASPATTITIDLASQCVLVPGGSTASFAIDPFARRCLLDGVDELAYLLGQADCISAYEAREAPAEPFHRTAHFRLA